MSRTTTIYASKVWETQTLTVARTVSEIWSEEGGDVPLVVSTQEQSVDGRHTWTSQFNASAYQEVQYPDIRDGSWKVVSTAPDRTSRVEQYSSGRLATVTMLDASAVQLASSSYSYDPHGRTQSVTDSRVGATTYTYYDDDRVATVTAPHPEIDGQFLVTTSFYNERGLLERRKLPDDSETFYTYTPQGQLDRTHGSQTYPVDYDYDSQGRMLTMTTWKDFAGDAGKAVTAWRYDPQRGQLAAKRDADGKEVLYTYTDAGRLATRTWARLLDGQPLVTHYDYHADGALATIDYSDATPDIAYSYYRHGQVREVRDGVLENGSISDANLRYRHGFSFDAALRLETENIRTSGDHRIVRNYETAGATTVAGRYSGFTFATVDNATSSFTSLSAVNYSYDSAGRLKTVAALDPQTSTPVSTYTYTYRTDASLIDTIAGPVHTVKLDYQPKGFGLTARTNKVGETVVSRYGYTLNALGQRTAAVNTGTAFGQPSHFAYRYNEKGEVTHGDRFQGDDPANPGQPIAPESFAYNFDDIGNRKTATTLAVNGEPGTANSVYASNLLNQYTQLSSTVNSELITENLIHDSDGNLTEDGRWVYQWNAENRLIAMETHPAAIAMGDPRQRLEFLYDYQGRRTAKKVFSWNMALGTWNLERDTRFLYDGWNLLAEFSLDLATSTLALQRSYVWGLDLSGSLRGAGGVGGLLLVTDVGGVPSPRTYTTVYDGNGDVTQYLDETGAVAAHFEYGPFGETIRATGEFASSAIFRFSTKYTDAESGLLYYGLRYYNPATGRWINREPLGENESPNLYMLVGNNAINHYDLNGLYGESGHFYTTYLVARAAGFDDGRAFKIAYGSQYPDEDSSYEAIKSKQDHLDVQKYLHSLSGGDAEKLRNYLGCLLKSDAFDDDEKGMLIHALGDAYTHSYNSALVPSGSPKNLQYRRESIPATLYPPVTGHLFSGHMPDYIASNPTQYGNYVDQLYDVLSSMNGGVPTNPDMIANLKTAAGSLSPPGLGDFFSGTKQNDYESNVIRNLPGGFNGSTESRYYPENETNPRPGMTHDADFRRQLIDKIKNGVKGCCPN